MKVSLAFLLAFLILPSFTPNAYSQDRSTVWAVDFVKTKDGHFEDYLKFIEANWVKARKEAQKQGYIVSYKVLTLSSNAEWDVLLITEYANISKYDAREENFKKVFETIRQGKGPVLINGLGARDLSDIKFSKLLKEAVFS
jgi:hypothetical protein